jgi:hypothetical protein
MSGKKPRNGLKVIKKQDQEHIKLTGDEAQDSFWDLVMDTKGFNIMFNYGSQNALAFSLYVHQVNH